MFDKYFCKRLHAKKITLDMVMDYITKSSKFRFFMWVLAGYTLTNVIINVYSSGYNLLYLYRAAFIFGGLLGIIAAIFRIYVAHRFTVASCPLRKNNAGGNNNV